MHKTNRKALKIVFLTCMVLLLTSCGHEHKWVEATCTEPKTCSECGKTDGEPLGHEWVDATCSEPKTCKVCGETEGEPLGHDFADATCTSPKQCTRCGQTQGDPLGHSVIEWTTTTEPTCTKTGIREGICTVCGDTINEIINAPGHVVSEDWEIAEDASLSSPGKKVKKCTVCGKQLSSKPFELTDEEKEEFRPSIKGDHFDCTVDDFIEYFKYKNQGSYTIIKTTSDDESQSYIMTAPGKLKCILVFTKTDEGNMKGILVQSDDDETSAIAVGLLMAYTIDDYFDPDDKDTTNEVAAKLFLGKKVEHDGLILGMLNLNDGTRGLVILPEE